MPRKYANITSISWLQSKTSRAATIGFGENGICIVSALCTRIITVTEDEAIIEVLFLGRTALVKCWSRRSYERKEEPLQSWSLQISSTNTWLHLS
ncbi:hypothetical protein BDV29DRAFT_180147 [Aspergillus leporis]|uniref:Uncharacterized protein n=1 Tax=Aspergillus leporis TaxID=41062 RepID=A0A5N5WUN7_9EURO|nr:hypothetical protein BDV29DRAFT_180147 [Aspergillus leporis]